MLHAPGALAVTLSPPADLSTSACTGACGASAANGDIGLSILASPRCGYMATSGTSDYGASPLVWDATLEAAGREVDAPLRGQPNLGNDSRDELLRLERLLRAARDGQPALAGTPRTGVSTWQV